MDSYDGGTLDIGAAAEGIPSAKLAPASGRGPRGALVTVEADAGVAARWWANGSTPDASTGHEVKDGSVIELEGVSEVQSFLAIRTGSTNVTMTYTLLR